MTDDPIPRNIAVTLRLLREMSGNSLRGMAEELNDTPGREVAGKAPGRSAKFDHDLLDAIESQERLKIWHLGRYANWYGVPAGAILLFSQLASHLRDGDADDITLTKSVAEAVRTVCDFLIAEADRMASTIPTAVSAGMPGDKLNEKLIRKCNYKGVDDEQKQQDACQVLMTNELLRQYPGDAKKLYQEHARKKFGRKRTNGS
jgi:hypothetical protein